MDGERDAVKVPVLGKVIGGLPVEASQEIIDYEEITKEMAKTGEFFALKVKGDSMSPEISESFPVQIIGRVVECRKKY